MEVTFSSQTVQYTPNGVKNHCSILWRTPKDYLSSTVLLPGYIAFPATVQPPWLDWTIQFPLSKVPLALTPLFLLAHSAWLEVWNLPSLADIMCPQKLSCLDFPIHKMGINRGFQICHSWKHGLDDNCCQDRRLNMHRVHDWKAKTLWDIFMTKLTMFERKTARIQSNQKTTKIFLTKEISRKGTINEAWKSVAVGRDTGVEVTADTVWLSIASCFLMAMQPYKGVQRSLPKGAAPGLVLAAWGSMWDPHPEVPGAVGTFSLLCILAGSEDQHEQQQGWKDYRGMRTRLYGALKRGKRPGTQVCWMWGRGR